MPAVRKPLLAVLLLGIAAGCGDGKVVQVTGTLTYKGKPVADAILHFLPEHGRQSWAQTDAQGRFKVNYDARQEGAVVGRHKVWVERRPTTTADKEAAMLGSRPAAPKELAAFFDKYSADKSSLTVEITKGTKELRLDLD